MINLVSLLSTVVAALIGKSDRSPVELINVRADDPQMQGAIAEARRTLPIFWAKFESGDPEVRNFTLKAGLTTGANSQEHVWLKVLNRTADRVVGTLDSDPVGLKDVSAGDELLVDLDRVSDWLYEKHGKTYGGYTMRALIDQMSPSKQDRLRRQLAPTPLEPDSH